MKRPKNLQQQSSLKNESTKVNAIIDQLGKSDGNGHCKIKTSNNLHYSMNKTTKKALSTERNPIKPEYHYVKMRR